MVEDLHIKALEAKHAALEAAIEEEISRPLPDNMTLNKLKREKLKVKEEIVNLENAS